MADLTLNLKGEYFHQIKNKEKLDEFRRFGAYWDKRLMDEFGNYKEFDMVVVRWGYPKAGDTEREIIRPFQFIEGARIKHPHFGDEPVWVHAIRVN